MNSEEKEKYKKKAKEIFNNPYTIVFSIFAFFVLLLGILNLLNVSTKIVFLQQIFYSFSAINLLFFGVMFILSAVLAHYKKFNLMFLPLLFWLIITIGIMRTANIPKLIDASTGNYTLGPDLDPFLFLRNAIEISKGATGEMDTFRYAPIGGAPTYVKSSLMPWAIYYLYNFLSLFSRTSITYAAIIAPVIFFILSTIGFFLFVKTLSSFKFSDKKSWTISTIATFFYAVVPSMLHRTVAGVPELESLGMVFFWFAFLFVSLAWKEKSKKKQILFGILSGIFTGAMSWTWGGYKYIYMVIFLTSFLIFLFEKEKYKNRLIFSSWFLPAILLEILKTKNIINAVGSISDTFLGLLLFLLIWIDWLLFESKLKNKIKLNKIKIPDSVKSLLIILIFGIVLGLIVKPSFVIGTFSNFVERLLYPFGRERVGLTVAENQVPYLTEVIGEFGNLFWIFFFGIIVLFYETVKHFNKKEKIKLVSGFTFFICAFLFSRISSESQILNGENLFSKIFYLSGLIVFAIILLAVYLNAYIKKDEKTLQDFKEINFSYFLLISFSIIGIISIRGAIRLFFIVAPIVVLISAFLPVKIYEYYKNSKDSLTKIIFIIILSVIGLMMISSFASYSSSIVYGTLSEVPSSYTQQWQYAMKWVRENTPVGSIFVHWWDYGYWVQTLGERPTVTDGGHYVGYWDHLTARYLLTEKNPNAALSLMKSYNVSYLLIDPTDFGKYSAFSKIGGDENYDTFSSIPIGIVDESQTVESKNTTIKVYQGNGLVDEDIFYNDKTDNIFIPGPSYNKYGEISVKAYVIGMILSSDGKGNFSQPRAVFYYNKKQITLPVRYLYYKGKLFDFRTGIDSIVQVIPKLEVSSSGKVSIEEDGAAIYLSPKVSKSLFARLYLLNDVFNEYPTVKVAHSEQNFLVKQLASQGVYFGEFIYYNGLQGPIKIWKVDYPENIIVHEEFLRTSGGWAEFDNLTFINNQ